MIGEFFRSLISPVTETIKGYNDGKIKIKEAQIMAKVAKYEAEARRWEKTADIEGDWDTEALRQSQYSWKDEWLTIIITFPFVFLFFPFSQEYVMKGFEYMDKAPLWYQTIFMGIVAASFGLRWLFRKKNL